ncbi:hypothetical protein DEAC_c35890 [Desulfosporosinus acididurans]|uniref:DUF2975 domain-containing protein n=1 Tax=Desulfosporosinus acididurans TaxID=476652 RepID=A0A0J1FLY6_9FIRM|nr:DUF2975 domain-containing protein [Desulfosporosinus acididurans]KLU64387.1 hypothetical protein DEAC_c35890 [Desulfosporosinus acididurans]
MSRDNLESLQKRAGSIHIVMEIIFVIGAIIFVAAMIGFIYFFFAPQDKFNVVKGTIDWSITYRLTGSSSFFINMPLNILQPLENSMVVAKHAFLTSMFLLLVKVSLIIYGVKQAADFLNSIANDKAPYVIRNVKRIKKIAYVLIFYSVAVDILSCLLYLIFVTKIFTLDLANVHLSGILSGVLSGGFILVIADLFKYGVFLQDEFNAKL